MKMLTFKNKVAYGLGDVGNNMSFALSSTFLLAFYVDVLGITAAAVGSLFLLARIFDGLNDPIMGTIAERRFAKLNNPKADKFRPFFVSVVRLYLPQWPPSCFGFQVSYPQVKNSRGLT
ncbi:hypothetical protein AAY53_05425 [Vibrio metoecus]|nr:hypothetical protein AAY53_05425 [Vibrio metoecus]